MKAFSKFIELQELVDLPLQGEMYTWTNKQDEPTMSHLDRFMTLPTWEEQYNQNQQIALPTPVSDRSPILLQHLTRKQGPLPFRFELMWLEVDGFKQKMVEW